MLSWSRGAINSSSTLPIRAQAIRALASMRLPRDFDITPVTVRLAYPAPQYAEQYREVFPGEVLFDQEATEFRYPKAWLEARVYSADEIVEQVCEAQCNRMLASLGSGESVLMMFGARCCQSRRTSGWRLPR